MEGPGVEPLTSARMRFSSPCPPGGAPVRRTALSLLGALAITASLTLSAVPASADHTDPLSPISPTTPGAQTLAAAAHASATFGTGTWEYVTNFPPNPGTDLELWKDGSDIYAATGTLGQANEGAVGQRIIRLVDEGTVAPEWVADHGSAACTLGSTSVTGLQHDPQIAGFRGSARSHQLLIDTTDAVGRCHDPAGGGLELIDISGIGDEGFEPREIHLIRHAGFSHTHTVDTTYPWIVYNSSSDFSGRPWIDVVDVRSCLNLDEMTLDEKRAACRPLVYRIPFQPDWSRQRDSQDGQLVEGSEAACHDITSAEGRLYCAGINATLIFDVSNLLDRNGNVRGIPLPCTLTESTTTDADVTDCSAPVPDAPSAAGWRFLGSYNHPGRDCAPRSATQAPNTSCNSNLFVPPDEGVSIAHEADPSHGGRFMFVTDERGGGVVPPGASCLTGLDNPLGNGGMHVFDIQNPSAIEYALTPEGDKAVFISNITPTTPTFCDIHVIEHIPREQRIIAAYYSGGTKIIDYWIQNGRIIFRETASLILPGANTWAVEDFLIERNEDGTRTYNFVATDINRGIDVFSWTGEPNPNGSSPPAELTRTSSTADLGLLGFGLVTLPIAALIGRRRRRSA
jgi:hypothetical protein